MFLTVGPETYSAPPVEIWMMPSLPASVKPCRAAFRVCEAVTLFAGYANARALAGARIWRPPPGGFPRSAGPGKIPPVYRAWSPGTLRRRSVEAPPTEGVDDGPA